MTTRRTAYIQHTEALPDDSGDVTVDLYILWPDGGEHAAASLLERTIIEVLTTLSVSSSPGSARNP